MAKTKNTESNSATVHEIFWGETSYRAPLFQRQFVWDELQLDTLWSDIDSVLEKSSSSKFLGALVLKSFQNKTATNPQGYWIIDGQQRLTTIYLLILACVNTLEKLSGKDVASDYVDSYLLLKQRNVKNQPKIVPTIPDFGQFREILNFIKSHNPKFPGGNFGDTNGLLADAFLRHLDEIEKRILVDGEQSVERLNSLIADICDKIEFVQIILADHHDANEVFNRLNVSGQPLEIIDLIRNEVFTLVSEDALTAESIYTHHWVYFEKSFNIGTSKEEIKRSIQIRDDYFFPYTLIKDSSTKKSDIFRNLSESWKKEVSSLNSEAAATKIINDLKEYVSPYLAFSIANRPRGISDELWEIILKLNRMPCPTTVYPYALSLLRGVEKEEIGEKEACKCFQIIESFLVRRAFIGQEPTGLHAIFKDLWKKTGASPQKVIANIQTRTIEFPDDDRFKQGIIEGELYRRKLCKYVLEEYERSFTKGDLLKSFPPITIDHLMPQERVGEWISIISEEKHLQLVHTWGNLVPLSNKANAEKGGKSWAEVVKHLQNETVFSTTKHVLTKNKEWGEKQIIKRSEELAAWALKRWPK